MKSKNRMTKSLLGNSNTEMIDNRLTEEEKYRLFFENSVDAIFLMSENRFVDCNPATLKMFSCKREEIIEQTPVKFSPEFQANGLNSNDLASEKINLAFSGKPQTFEWLHKKLNGEVFDAEVSLSCIQVNDNFHLLAIVRDISKRKHAEKTMAVYREQTILQNNSLKLINQFSADIKPDQDAEKIALMCIDSLSIIIQTPFISVYFLKDRASKIELAVSKGFDKKTVENCQKIPLKNSISGLAILGNKIQISNDIYSDSRLNRSVVKALEISNISSLCVAPLFYQGKSYGSLNICYRQHHCFSDMEAETITVVANTLAQALANSKKIRDFDYLAHHDSLTQLPNRLSYHEDFSIKAKNGKFESGLLLFDLNGFKEVNDTLGHHIGDVLLKKIGERLNRVFKNKQTNIYRLGGDEFILLFSKTNDPYNVQVKAKKILQELQRPFSVEKIELEIDASIGISLFPKDGKDSHELLRSADVAMYDAKNNGLGISIYDGTKDKNSIARLSLMTELNKAISYNELVLHYQPKVDCNSGEIDGFEALVRWQHPKSGLLFPDSFIPLAELSEVIHPLTEKIFLIAVDQQKSWLDEGYQHSVSINLSTRNLNSDRFVDFLTQYSRENQLKPELIEFEVTETALMKDIDMAMLLLIRIADLGFKISIDDFGTGYSSFAHLRRMPLNALKIDREFVKELQDNDQDSIIVSSIIGLAHNLNLTVIAEGVETETHKNILSKLGCDQLQGYGVCKPNSWDNIKKWVVKHCKNSV